MGCMCVFCILIGPVNVPGEVNFKAALRPTPKPTSSPGPPTASIPRPQPQQQPQQQPPPWVLITSTTGMGLNVGRTLFCCQQSAY